jgi:hypothetical protein
LNFKDHLAHVFNFYTKQHGIVSFKQCQIPWTPINKQLHDACPVLHSNLLSVCRLEMVTSLSNLTAHLSGNCALLSALKELIKPIIPMYLMEWVIWRYRPTVAYDEVYKRLPKLDEHVEKLLKE